MAKDHYDPVAWKAWRPNSCGCLFCDMGDTPRDFQGKPAHYQRDHTVILCTKGAVEGPAGAN